MACGLGPSGVSLDDSLNTFATPGALLLPGTYGSISSTPARGWGYPLIAFLSPLPHGESLFGGHRIAARMAADESLRANGGAGAAQRLGDGIDAAAGDRDQQCRSVKGAVWDGDGIGEPCEA